MELELPWMSELMFLYYLSQELRSLHKLLPNLSEQTIYDIPILLKTVRLRKEKSKVAKSFHQKNNAGQSIRTTRNKYHEIRQAFLQDSAHGFQR